MLTAAWYVMSLVEVIAPQTNAGMYNSTATIQFVNGKREYSYLLSFIFLNLKYNLF